MLNNQECFLDEPAWTVVLQSVTTTDPLIPEWSPPVISLIMILVTIPRLFKDFTFAICHCLDPQLAIIKELIARAQKLRMSLQSWHKKYIELKGPSDGVSYTVVVMYYLCSIYSDRLNTSIFWGTATDISEIENEAQKFSKIIVSLSNQEEAYTSLQSSLLLAQKLPIAEATIRTSLDWRMQLSYGISKALCS